jgi:endonuclease YncB( thermonuclease family)
MVSAGMAWAFVRYSNDCIGQEARATVDWLGVHAHDCTVPWEWRAQRSQ